MKRVLEILPPKPASYVALAAYAGMSAMDFPGDWAVSMLALLLFLYFRFFCHRVVSEELKTQYIVLGVGYAIFLPLSCLVIPLAMWLFPGARPVSAWLILNLDLLYLLPAAIYLIILDRKKARDHAAVATDARGPA